MRKERSAAPRASTAPEATRPADDDERPQRRHTGLDPARFPVVTLGASAGGLSALELFFEHLPRDSGMAFVIITHQAPDRTTMLPELLSKRASIPIATATDGQRLLPDHAYLAPPGYSLLIKDESLHLNETGPRRAAGLPIDAAFRSLAVNEGDQAIAIVLSGNGSDGTLGIAEVKGAYGLVMAQDPGSAQYPGMPASAIATQLVDYVLKPEQMPAQLISYVRGRRQGVTRGSLDGGSSDGALQKILAQLRARTGSDFSAYKKSTIRRRIERRMHVHNLVDPEEYARFLEHTGYEVDALFKELLISVTSFFRDAQAFEVLEHELAKLIELKSDAEALRMWIPGCATGEEAYSIAIVAREALQRSGKDYKLQIFATDLDQQAIEVARAGRYPEGIGADVSAERLKRFFTREDSGYRINKDLRERIVFAVQNVTKDPPFTKVDLVACRNLLIYLESDLQKRVLGLFSYALRPDGLLFLGTSESVSGFDDRFATLDKRWKLFQRLQSAPAQLLPDFYADRATSPAAPIGHALVRDARSGPAMTHLAERVLLSSFVPPSIIVSERGELIYVQGPIGKFFEPAAGEPTNNIFNMAREGLRGELPAAVRAAGSSQRPVVRRSLNVKTNGGFSAVNMTVRRLLEPEALRGAYLVSFEPVSEPEAPGKQRDRTPPKSIARVTALEDELRHTRENLQGMIEELETSNEELKSTNEELQSTNEELQSANEELETSREEMQSLNEELQTVNNELEARNRALSATNDDMQNLLNSTDVATVFLDDKLNIKRFTTQAKKVFSLIDTDIGRPIADLAANLRYDALVAEAQEVLNSLVFREREIQTKEGQWRQMRIMPYRTHDNLIDGLVMTFVDIDRLKRAQRSELEMVTYVDDVLDSLKTGVLVVDRGGHIASANQAFCGMFGAQHSWIVGQAVSDLERVAADFAKLAFTLDAFAAGNDEPPRELLRMEASAIRKPVVVTAKRLRDYQERSRHVVLMFDPQ